MMFIFNEHNVFLFLRYYGQLKPKGHVIACRITAENPDEVYNISNCKFTQLVIYERDKHAK